MIGNVTAVFPQGSGDLRLFPDGGSLPTTSNLNYNVNANVVHTYKTSGGASFTTQFGTQYETRDLKINRVLAANLVGGIQTVTNREGTVTTTTYDDLKRLSTITANGITATRTYDAAGDVLYTTRTGTNGTTSAAPMRGCTPL